MREMINTRLLPQPSVLTARHACRRFRLHVRPDRARACQREAGRGIEAQAHQVLANLRAVLEAAGAGFGDVVKTTMFLVDMADFQTVNVIYAAEFAADPPARSRCRWPPCRDTRWSRSKWLLTPKTLGLPTSSRRGKTPVRARQPSGAHTLAHWSLLRYNLFSLCWRGSHHSHEDAQGAAVRPACSRAEPHGRPAVRPSDLFPTTARRHRRRHHRQHQPQSTPCCHPVQSGCHRRSAGTGAIGEGVP